MNKNLLPFCALLLMLAACHWTGKTSKNGVSAQAIQLIADSEQMLEEDLDSAWTLLEEASEVAQAANDKLASAEVLLAMSRYQNMTDCQDSAVSSLLRGLAVCPDAPDSMLAQYYAELSATYNRMGQMEQSVEYAVKAMPLMKQYGSDEDYAIMCGNLGISYRRLGINDSAAAYYERGLKVALQSGDYDSEAYLANNLSVLYSEMSRLPESIHYAQQAATAADKAGDKIEFLSAQANMGVALLLDNQTDKALPILVKTFEQADSTDSSLLKLKLLNYLLKAFVDKKDFDATNTYLAKGERLAAQLPAGSIAAAGILESKMIVQTETGDYHGALQTIAQIEELMPQQQVIPTYRLLSYKARCLAAIGNTVEAYRLQTDAATMADSVKNKQNAEKLDQLTVNYKVMEKQLEVATLNQQKARLGRTVTILMSGILLLVAAVISLLLYLRTRRQQEIVTKTMGYLQGIEEERKRFAHEIHDGACNELLAIGLQLRNTNPPPSAIISQTANLRDQLRNLSHQLMPPQLNEGVTLDQALAYYLSHIETPTVSFTAKGDNWETIPTDTAYHVYRIIQEAVGNIIVHQPKAKADVCIKYINKVLSVNIVSKGDVVKTDDPTGIGMRSMTHRATAIGMNLQTYYSDDTFTLELSRLKEQ